MKLDPNKKLDIKELLKENTERKKLLTDKELWKIENANFLTISEADNIIKRIM